MELKSYLNNVVKGVIGAFAVTVLLTAIFSLIISFVEFSPSIYSGVFVVITSLGLIFGTILFSFSKNFSSIFWISKVFVSL